MFLQLRVVFDACDCDEEGRISLADLADLSRSHTDNQVDHILEIFNVRAGDEEGFLTCSPAWGSAAAPPQVNLLLKQAPHTNLFSILDVGASI